MGGTSDSNRMFEGGTVGAGTESNTSSSSRILLNEVLTDF